MPGRTVKCAECGTAFELDRFWLVIGLLLAQLGALLGALILGLGSHDSLLPFLALAGLWLVANAVVIGCVPMKRVKDLS